MGLAFLLLLQYFSYALCIAVRNFQRLDGLIYVDRIAYFPIFVKWFCIFFLSAQA